MMNEMIMMNEYFQHDQQLFVEDLNIKFHQYIIGFLKSYLPTLFDCNNWLKLIVSEVETGLWIATLLSDDRVEWLFVVEEESKRKFSKPGGGAMDCCLSILDDEQQTKSVTWFKKTSSNGLGFDVGIREDTNKAAKSTSVEL